MYAILIEYNLIKHSEIKIKMYDSVMALFKGNQIKNSKNINIFYLFLL